MDDRSISLVTAMVMEVENTANCSCHKAFEKEDYFI